MKTLARWVDGKVNLIAIIFLFWAIFWGLNGGDKFLNGEYAANLDDSSVKAVLVDEMGGITHRMHTMETIGPFGVNRDEEMVAFFQRVDMPAPVALAFLYGIGVLEVVLGVVFLALLSWHFLPEGAKARAGLLSDRTLQSLAFKGTMLLFVMFAAGDILFGERTELWEHCTFLILAILTYNLWHSHWVDVD